MSQDVDVFLEHYGVKGMKWGVRRSDSQLRRARGRKSDEPESEDRKTAVALKSRSISSLSNTELRRLNERMQLEQTYAQLTGKQSTVNRGRARAEAVLNTAKKISEVYNLINSPAAKALRTAIEKK